MISFLMSFSSDNKSITNLTLILSFVAVIKIQKADKQNLNALTAAAANNEYEIA